MNITIYTDASSNSYKRAYACWITSDKGRIRVSSLCPEEIKNIGQAEIFAILQAVMLAQKIWGLDCTDFTVKTDSNHAIKTLTKSRINGVSCPIEKKLMAVYGQCFARKYNYPTIRFIKVLSKDTTDTTAAHINNWCDQEAKKLTRAPLLNQ